MNAAQVWVLIISLVVITAGASVVTGETTQNHVTEVSSCRIIDEPGTYVLTQDLEPTETLTTPVEDAPGGWAETLTGCLVVALDPSIVGRPGDGVFIEGNGHTISGENVAERTAGGRAVGAAISSVFTIHATNVEVTGWDTGIYSDGVANIDDITATENGIGLHVVYGGGNVTNSTIAQNDRGIRMSLHDLGGIGPYIAGNVIEENKNSGISIGGGEQGVVQNNTISKNGGFGISISFHEGKVEISRNTISENDGPGINVGISSSVRIAENLIEKNEGSGIQIQGFTLHSPPTCSNCAPPSVTAHRNHFEDNGAGITAGIVQIIQEDEFNVWEDIIPMVEVNGSLFSDEPVNATENYWGDSEGPASPDDPDAPFEDPVTGTLASGEGDTVSEGPRPGVSNVHFDSWLEMPPDVGVGEPSGDRDDTDEQTDDDTTADDTPDQTDDSADEGTQENVTEVSSCRIIDEPGTYVLTQDLEPTETLSVPVEDPPGGGTETLTGCLVVTVDPTVVGNEDDEIIIEGNGQTISGKNVAERTADGRAVGAAIAGVFSLDVANVEVTGWATGIYSVGFAYVNGVTATENGIGLNLEYAGGDVTNSTISRNGDGLSMDAYDFLGYKVQITGNVIERNNGSGISLGPLDAQIRDNVIQKNGGPGIDTHLGYITVCKNTIKRNGGGGITGFGASVIATENLITENQGAAIYFDGTYEFLPGIRANYNHFEDNGAGVILGVVREDVRIDEDPLPPLSEGQKRGNATLNYWGAETGPASPEDPDAPFEDPVTGTLASGEGDTVSESPTPGISNVLFDPWLDMATGAGVGEHAGDRDDTDEQTDDETVDGTPDQTNDETTDDGTPDQTDESAGNQTTDEGTTPGPGDDSTGDSTGTATDTGCDSQTATPTESCPRDVTPTQTATETATSTATQTGTKTSPLTPDTETAMSSLPSPTDTSGRTDGDTDGPTDTGIPGFGAIVAVIALIALALLAIRRA